MGRFQRWALIGVVAYASASFTHLHHSDPGGYTRSDLWQIWTAGRLLLSGGDPYRSIGPGLEYPWAWPFLYPMTAAWLFAPFARVPMWVLDALVVAGAASALAWWLTRNRTWSPGLLVFVSFPWVYLCLTSEGWAPLMLLSAVAAPFGMVLAAKPTIGAAVWLAYPRWRSLAWAAGLVLLSLLAWPSWPLSWLSVASTQATIIVPPITRPFGWLIALCLLRWRRREARLLFALACVPQTALPYEAVLLFIVVQTWFEGVALLALSYVEYALYLHTPHGDWASVTTLHGALMIWCCYLPCAGMILRRPNVDTTTDQTAGRQTTPVPQRV